MFNASKSLAKATSTNDLMLKSVAVDGDVYGGIFEAKVTQQFTNPTTESVEVIYTFPLPIDATLLRVDVLMGEKRLSGKIVAKSEANITYEEILSEGDAAILLERAHDGNYVISLGNLAPGEECCVEISYAHMLAFEQDSLRIRIPTVIAPRYGDPHNDGKLLPHQVLATNLLAEYEFALELRLRGQLANSRVASPSHLIRIGPAGYAGLAVATVNLGSRALLDRDFILVIDQLQSNSIVTLSPDMNQHDNYALISSFRPSIVRSTELPIALKILVDCSGSMEGDSIQATKNALHEVLSSFEEDDKFSLSRFGTTVEHRSRALWSTKKRTMTSAAQWVDDLQADMGGTNIEEALESTFRLTSSKRQPCDVLLITDGSIYAIDETLEIARDASHRIFIVAIGSSPEGNFLTQLSQVTGGACEFVGSGERAASAITRMFSRIRATKIHNLSVTWPEPVQPAWVSNIVTSVFSGDTTHLYAWLSKEEIAQARGKELRLVGNVGEDGEQKEFARVRLEIDDQEDSANKNFAVSRFVAAQCITQSCDQDQKESLALDYQLVTNRTSLIMINQRSEADKATKMPGLKVVHQMMPAGQSGFGSVQFSISDLDSTVTYDSRVPSVLRNPKISHQSTHSKSIDSVDIPSFLRKDVGVDKRSRLTNFLNQSSVLDVAGKIYWVRTLDTASYHYAVIEENSLSGLFLIWFFILKRKNWSWREEALVFDNIEFPDEETARVYLVSKDFREIKEGTPPGMRKVPNHLRLQLRNLKRVYSD